MFKLCFLFKATFQMTDLTHLCTMLPEIAAQIVVLNNDGRSVRYIAQHLNIPRSTVQDALSRFRETHGFTRSPVLAARLGTASGNIAGVEALSCGWLMGVGHFCLVFRNEHTLRRAIQVAQICKLNLNQLQHRSD
jgi:hypothetical protein